MWICVCLFLSYHMSPLSIEYFLNMGSGSQMFQSLSKADLELYTELESPHDVE